MSVIWWKAQILNLFMYVLTLFKENALSKSMNLLMYQNV